MEFDIPVTVKDFLGPHYGIIVRGPEVLAVDQQDNPELDLDQITLRPQMILNSIGPLHGRRRYQGQVTWPASLYRLSSHLTPIAVAMAPVSGQLFQSEKFTD